jgi:hypothetical protein
MIYSRVLHGAFSGGPMVTVLGKLAPGAFAFFSVNSYISEGG